MRWRSARKRGMQKACFWTYPSSRCNCRLPDPRTYRIFCGYSTVLEFVTSVTISYAPYKLPLQSPPNLETGEKKHHEKHLVTFWSSSGDRGRYAPGRSRSWQPAGATRSEER